MSEPLTMSPLQQAVVAIQRLRVRNAELEQAAAAPIAVVGMGCRLPAGGSSPAALWEALSGGRDGSMEVPADRWDIDALYDPNLGTPGKMYVRKGCFIPDVDLFDPLFFRISPREAIGMDPQQRLLLEVTWEALEDAGLSATRLVGSQTGVFLGISTKDYATLLGRSAHGSDSNATAGAGTAASVASGRLSYVFGFHGPCFAVDTACSSSLVATHLAVQALRAKECGLAIVAGVNLMLTPDITVNFCQGRLLSPDGQCKTFDAAASGYARGEGCGVVVLKRLADAVADGDRVQAVIRGSAINQDGRSAGLTAPNGLAQEAVIRQALANAGLPPEAIDAIEAHGTGTALGDPIEMHALKGVFEDKAGPLHVGSIKANIGHAEAAAGISGLIKAVLMLQHQEVPPLLHFNQLNPHIDLGGMDVRIPTALVPAALSQIGVSSFGWSGTNAHVVLGAAPPPEPAKAASGEAQPPRLLISARTPEALRELIGRYREFFAIAPHSFADACHTAAVGRARQSWWVCVERSEELDTAVPSRAPLPEIPVTTGRKIQLPKYPFERQRYWAEATPAAPVEETDPAAHPLLGKRLVLPMSRETRWEARLSSQRPGLQFLAEHEVAGRAVLPAACFVEMALAASPDRALEDIEIVAPLPVAAETDRLVQTIADGDGSLQIVSSTAEATDATVHIRCRAVPLAPASPPSLDLPERDGTALDADALYAAMARRGVRHGPSFRLLDGITRGDGWARARLRDGQGGRFRLDPTRLDAAFQLAAAALPNTDDETLVPVRVGRFALHHAPAEAAVVTVRASRDEAGASADILVTDAAGLAIEVRRLRFQAAQRDGTALHTLRWKDAPLVAHPGRAGFLPEAGQLAQALEAEGRRLAALHDMADYERAGQAMEALATQYAVATLRRLGMSFEAGEQFTVGALAGSLGVAERHGRLFRRLLAMLEEDGVLARTNRRMTVVHKPAAEDCDAALRALLLRFPAMAGEIGLLGRCGEALAGVLTGQTEPLGLLFPADGNEGGAGAFYENSAYARTINGLLSAAAGQIAARLPPGRVLRVLEAGAGTGGATGAMLGAIPRDARHYVFTDVSRGFLAAAERKFAGEGLFYRLLDTEAPGEGQGFTPASFDLVLAANVLHATRDLRCSLGNLRELLAPGGLLLLVEGTEARRWTDIIFGLTEGWWRFEDADLRPHHPLLAAERWTALLGECGFEAAGMTGEVILARRPHEPAVEAEGWHLLGATAAGLPAALAAAGARVAGKEAQHWICTLPPAPPEEAAQAGLLDDLVAVAREAMRQPEAPTLTILAEDGLGHAGVSGFVRTLALEAPQLRPRMLLGSPGLESLVDELLAMDREAEVRWTVEGRRQVPRLVPAERRPSALPAAIGGAWLITGGRGGVSLEVARWLAAHGAREIILLSRRRPAELPAMDAPVRFYEGDVSDEALIASVFEDNPGIEGVVHAAGVLADAPLDGQTRETIDTVVHAKIGGALTLHREIRRRPAVRHLVFFASAAGVLGSARQSNHAFCSSFLDALARQRREDGLPAISLDWGVWNEVGSAAERGFDVQATLLGLGSIAPEQGVRLFAAALREAPVQWLVLPSVDWRRFTRHFDGGVPALYEDVAAAPASAPASAPEPATPAASARERLERVVAQILGMPAGTDPQTPLRDLGLDSLMAVEVKNRAERELGVAVSVRELIEGASINSLLERLPVPPQETAMTGVGGIAAIVARLLRLPEGFDQQAPLNELGLDSLVAVEIRNTLETELGFQVSVRELIEGVSVQALMLRHGGAGTNTAEAVPAVRRIRPDVARRHEPFPLTEMQQAYWLGRRHDLELGNVACYLYTEFDTSSQRVDLDRAEAAWNRLVRRHDMLRVVIRPDGTQQILEEAPEYRFKRLDLRGRPEAQAELERLRRSLPRRVAEPNAWPLFDIRVTLFEDKVRLHTGFDLIALDAASIHALRQEWGRLYDDPTVVLPPIGLSFRDFVLEQQAHRASPEWQHSERYWSERAASLPAGPELPVLGDPARQSGHRFQRHRVTVAPEEAMALRRQAQVHGLTLPTLLAAAYAEILAAWSATSHFCITVTSFNRPTSLHENISALLGDFTSTILLEIDARAPGFLDRAMALSRRLAADLDHAAVSGIQVLREAARQKGSGWASYVPIVFTSALGFQRPGASDAGSASWDRLGTTVFNVSSTPQVLIDHQISEEDGNLFCNWDVAESLFAPGTVVAMVAAYRALLGDLAAGRGWDRPVAVTLPSLDHRAPLVPVPPPEPLHAAFERHARQMPNRLALVTPEGEFSYGVLDAAAGHLAAALLSRLGGAEAARDRLVAIGFAKGWRQVLAVLAVLKAGAAYLPVDPALPPERRRLLIERSEALPLDDPALPEAALAAARAGRPVLALPPVEDAERLAYVIYTSGSTGEPKGVMIEHGAALGTVREVNRRWQVGAEDRVLGLSALGFDLSVYDIFGPLSAGGALILPNPAATRDPAHWAAMLRDHRATIWNSVPALMAMQCEYGLPAGHALRLVLLSGDWVPLELVPQLRDQAPAARLVALGGATEAAIWSNCHEIGELDPDWPSMPYGTPLAGQMLHVVNPRGEPCPDWVTGEIEIAGQGLARGYWRDPVQTAERFRRDPLTGERRYRTGDRGRFRPYATAPAGSPTPIEFLGRDDLQVKIGGHRVELGEIEAILGSHSAVTAAVATAVATDPANSTGKTLHAFVTLAAAVTDGNAAWQRSIGAAQDAAAAQAVPIEAERFTQVSRTLDEQAAAAAAAALRHLAGSAEIPTAEALIREHGVAPRYRDWLERMLPAARQVAATAEPITSREIGAEDVLGFSPAAMGLFDQVITGLPDILTERLHSSAIYLSAETPEVYGRLFAEPNAVISEVLRSLGRDRPTTVLEVGGGLGTTLAAVEPRLPLGMRYLFTDVSNHMLRLTAARFSGRDWLSFARLDLDAEPAAEHLGRFDAIVASSALHVAPDIGRALRHLRSCLAPGGVLVALEQTRFLSWFDLNMGLQAGFDDRRDRTLRPNHPLLSREAWLQQMEAAGFEAAEAVSEAGGVADRLGFAVILARAGSAAEANPSIKTELRERLRERLPAYMVPATVEVVDALPLSANGKIDRKALAALVRAEAGRRTAPAASAAGLEREVGELVAAVLELDSADPQRSLFELGATSLTLVALQRRLSQRFGRALPLQSIFERPTVADFARELGDLRTATSALVTFDTKALRAEDDRPRLVMMPGIFSLPFYLRELAEAAAEELAIVSVQLPGLGDGETPIDTVEEQAAYALERLRLDQPEGPYLIAGYSFGGLIAIEVARRLHEAGEAAPLLALGDTVRTSTALTAFQTDDIAHVAMTRGLYALYGRSMRIPYEALLDLPPAERFARTARTMQEEGLFGALDLPLDRMVQVFKANFAAIGAYRPDHIPGDLAVIRTEGGMPAEYFEHETGEALKDPALGWSDLVGGRITMRSMPGDHLAMLDMANLPVMVDILTELVRDALARHLRDTYGQYAAADATPTKLNRELKRLRAAARRRAGAVP